MTSQPCLPQRRLLAREAFCAVEQCGCGTLHVSVLGVTLRLPQEAVACLWETLGLALGRLAAAERARELPS